MRYNVKAWFSGKVEVYDAATNTVVGEFRNWEAFNNSEFALTNFRVKTGCFL